MSNHFGELRARYVAYLGRKAETDGNGAGDGTLAGAVRSQDAVERGTREELDVVVGDKRLTSDAHDGSGDVAAVTHGTALLSVL